MTRRSAHTPADLSALADRSGEVHWDRLAPLAASRDVVVGELLDEELLLCRRFAGLDAEPHPHWTPYQCGLDPALRAVTVRTVERLNVAHGLIMYPDDAADSVDLSVGLDALVMAFERAVVQLTWRWELGELAAWAGAVLVLDDGTILHDDINREAGQHVLTFRSREREVIFVDGSLDPDNLAGPALPVRPAGAAPEAVPDPRRLADVARTITELERGDVWGSGPPQRHVRAFGTEDGLWVLEDGAPEAEAGLRRLADDGMSELALHLLS